MHVLADNAKEQQISSTDGITEHPTKLNESAEEKMPLNNDSAISEKENTSSSDKIQGNYILIDSS